MRDWLATGMVLLAMVAAGCLEDEPWMGPTGRLSAGRGERGAEEDLSAASLRSGDLRRALITARMSEAGPEYAFKPNLGGAFSARHVQQGLTFNLGPYGLTITPRREGLGSWQGGLRLAGVGREGRMVPSAISAPVAVGNRVSFNRGNVTEWYLHGPMGLEQGFDIGERPSGDGPLLVEVVVSGLKPQPGRQGQISLVVEGDERGQRLEYSDLYAVDAQGMVIDARMEVRGNTVRLVLEDRTATYPLTVDPLVWAMQQRLIDADGDWGDGLGVVAISGEIAMAGSVYDSTSDDNWFGSVSVFVRSDGVWTQRQKLRASVPNRDAGFGISIAIEGDVALVGASHQDFGVLQGAGAVFVFENHSGIWAESQILTASDLQAHVGFGASVSISGDTAVISAPWDKLGTNYYQGAAYVFRREGGLWIEQQKLTASAAEAENVWFGRDVAVDGTTVVVGVSSAPPGGAAVVFDQAAGVWTQTCELTSSDGQENTSFGWSVAISGDSIIIGAPSYDIGYDDSSGAIYMFGRSAGVWSELQRFAPSPFGDAGRSVSISGGTAVAGAPSEYAGEFYGAGAAYVFVLNEGTWELQQKLTEPWPWRSNALGSSVAISNDTILASTPSAPVGGNDDQGAVYVFVRGYEAGDECVVDNQCLSVHCVDGVCCDSACGSGNPTDCMACSISAGGTVDGICGALDLAIAPTVTCRDAAGICDVPESCNSASLSCPEDGFVGVGTECRGIAGICDLAEVCTGSSADCPEDAKSRAVCRGSAGPCDLPDRCDGFGNGCPLDLKSTSVCRWVAGACDVAESCDGVGDECPLNGFVPAGTECRVAIGVCDLAEACTGFSAACPGDGFVITGAKCREAAGVCDLAEACTGAGPDCPDDLKSTAECRDPEGPCDVAEACDGVGNDCPADGFMVAGTECRPETGPCDLVEACSGEGAACPEDGFAPAGTVCRAAECVDGAERAEAVCTGDSAECPRSASMPCDPFVCGLSACLVTCASDSECVAGFWCDEGECLALADLGTPCVDGTGCKSGFCIDGVCCDLTCGRQCEACDLAGSEGTCMPIEGAPHGGRTSCASDGSVCGGACDGVYPEGCAYPGESVQCRSPSCADGIAILEAFCQGEGNCPVEQTQTCGPFACSGDLCGGECVFDYECNEGHFCAAGVCVERMENGEACAGDAQCAGGRCVDGFCCASACSGQCEACDLAGFEGTCTTVDGSPHGGRPACEGTGPCASNCDGISTDACILPGTGTACTEAHCIDGFSIPPGSCDGAGGCSVPAPAACEPYLCGADECLSACTDDEDCAPDYRCFGAECVPNLPVDGCGCGAAGTSSASESWVTLLFMLGFGALLRRRF